jgi:hypothetical protein
VGLVRSLWLFCPGEVDDGVRLSGGEGRLRPGSHPVQLAPRDFVREPMWPAAGAYRCPAGINSRLEVYMGSLVKKRRKKMSKHKYRKRIKANRHKRKK